jgi:hypothetical protein
MTNFKEEFEAQVEESQAKMELFEKTLEKKAAQRQVILKSNVVWQQTIIEMQEMLQ